MKISEIRKHLKSFRVGIAGAGGLGSNCAAALARSGVGKLVIADYDIIEPSNIYRQFYFSDQTGMKKTEALSVNLLRISPEIDLILHDVMLTPENIPVIFSGCDVIVEAFDTPEMKEMITGTVLVKMPGTPLVIGSGIAGWDDAGSLKCRKVDDFLFVCGDESTEVTDELPPLAPRVGIVSHMQANVVISILLNKKMSKDEDPS